MKRKLSSLTASAPIVYYTNNVPRSLILYLVSPSYVLCPNPHVACCPVSVWADKREGSYQTSLGRLSLKVKSLLERLHGKIRLCDPVTTVIPDTNGYLAGSYTLKKHQIYYPWAISSS